MLWQAKVTDCGLMDSFTHFQGIFGAMDLLGEPQAATVPARAFLVTLSLGSVG
jgi:hypothetical protein